jgi:quinol-cytochrome oxidoreductase complex cytochrome b subunit
MTEDENTKVTGIYSKFWRITLVIGSMLLIFVGPTYVPYVLANMLKRNYFISIGIGFILFIIGMGLMILLIRKKLITV